MNWFNLFNFLFKIQCAESVIKISKEYFLENNFWHYPRYIDKTHLEHLYQAKIDFKEINSFGFGTIYYSNSCFYLYNIRQRYIYLHKFDAESFIFPLNFPQVDKKFIRFNFSFTNYQTEEYNKELELKGEIRRFETFKWPERSSETANIINLKFYEDAARKINLKENIISLIDMEFLKCEKYIKDYTKIELFKKMINDNYFELFYFQNYLQCLEILLEFTKSFQNFRLVEDEVSDEHVDMKTTMKISKFIQLIDDKFADDLETTDSNLFKNTNYKDLNVQSGSLSPYISKCLIKKCFYRLFSEMLKKEICFPITGKYNIDYYINMLYQNITELVKANQEKYDSTENPEKKDSVFEAFFFYFFKKLKNEQKTIMKELYDTDLFFKHFSELLKKPIETSEDYVIVEKIVCDYHNMLVYLSNMSYSLKKSFISTYYRRPIFADNYKCRIITGIKIEVETRFFDFLSTVEAFDDKEKRIYFNEHEHWFIDQGLRFYTTLEILEKLEIKKLKVVTLWKKVIKWFDINDFLNH